MTKAVIFDCFGVLVAEGWKPFREKHFLTQEEREWAREAMQRANRAEISIEHFAELIRQKTGVSPEDFFRELHSNPADEELLEYIAELGSRYKIGFLSNVNGDRLSDLFTKEQLALFDYMTLSYQLGVSKPSPMAYLHTAEMLEVLPEECIFVDDTKSYCEGAEAVGMTAILYTGFEDFKTNIENILWTINKN